MPWRRRILLLLAVAALFAMHGATASSASAAVPCGAVPGQVHTGVASPAALGGPALDGPALVAPTGAEGDAAMACVVMLAAGLALVAGMRRVDRTGTPSDPSAGPGMSASRGRSPPVPLRASLCV
ncbi:MAG: hypothetical protein Q7V58_14925 [Actinomycetota bacterium]|nr:hypothetical protein [Actinomycetota bacterium]